MVEPLQRMFAEGPQALQDVEFAAACSKAVATVGHELEHLYGPEDCVLGDWRLDLLRDEVDSIEEAFTDLSAYERASRLIAYALPPSLAEPLIQVRMDRPDLCQPGYGGYVDAARAFTSEVERELDIPVSAVAGKPASGRGKSPLDARISTRRTPLG